ncbi:MAG: hypothetical protein Q8929_15540, partial [Bacillota bacterium]|nr:hypothetical protein [Bacillota bacterium]
PYSLKVMFRNLARLWRNDLIKNQSNLYKTIVFLFLQNFVFYLFFTRKFFSSQALDSFINTFSPASSPAIPSLI